MPSTALENLIGNFTLAELAQRSGKSVAEIVGFALGNATTRAPKNGQPRRASTSRTPQTTIAVDTRTRQGRADLDARVLDAIRNLGTAKAKDLEGVGGDELQRRASLHRLIAAKKIKREGAARGTTYTARS